MSNCMLCNSPEAQINVYEFSDAQSHNVRNDLVTFFGENVIRYLKPNDTLCLKCANVMENFSYIQRFLTSRIFRNERTNNNQQLYFGKLWDLLSTLKFHIDCIDVSDTNTPNTSGHSVSSSLVDLLEYSHIVPYDPLLEKKIEIRENYRTLRRNTVKSQNDEEIEILMGKRSGSRKRKNNRPRTNVSVRRRPRSERAHTDGEEEDFDDNCSYLDSYIAPKKKRRPSTHTMTTRSTSRLEVEIVRARIMNDEDTWICSSCRANFDSLRELTIHMIFDHNRQAFYTCDQCEAEFTEKTHLLQHKITHDRFYYNCFMCGMEVLSSYNLQKHLNDHKDYSVPCNHCDKSFLSNALCEQHIKEHHKGKKYRVRHQKILIYDRIDKSEEEETMVKVICTSPVMMIQNEKVVDVAPRRTPSEEAELTSAIVQNGEHEY